MFKNKIIDKEKLIRKLKVHKSKSKKIVLCHGVFDLVHIGHIKYFLKAKKLGDILIVSLTADRFVNKGPGRPIFNENLRSEFISNIGSVDYVLINEDSTSVKLINLVKPDIYFKGKSYKNKKNDITKKIYDEANAVQKNNGKIIFSNDEEYSSSQLINNHFNHQSHDQKTYINEIKKISNYEIIKNKIDNLKNISVTLIGEIIIDEYIFCDVVGKAGKEPMMVYKQLSAEKYLGGILAIAKHMSSFVKSVNVVSFIGDNNNLLEFIKDKIDNNINLKLLKKNNSPTILKKRYVDNITNTKLNGVYLINDEEISNSEESIFLGKIKNELNKNDLVLCVDYGHGIITNKVANYISKKSKFLSVNSQFNSFNSKFHTISKIKNINSLILNENEIRNEFKSSLKNLKSMTDKLIKSNNIKQIIITSGDEGARLFEKNKKQINVPAFANKIIDKIGTGDAFLSMYTLANYAKIDKKSSLLLASLAASISLETVGNSSFINKINILKALDHILK